LEQSNHKPGASARVAPTVFWRVEGSLLDLTVVQPVAFFTWNAQSFSERFRRRGLIFLMAVLRPFLENRMSLAANFLIASGYTGQTTEVLAYPPETQAMEQVVGVPLKSYVSASWTYYFRK